jgi:hypothetical protein
VSHPYIGIDDLALNKIPKNTTVKSITLGLTAPLESRLPAVM